MKEQNLNWKLSSEAYQWMKRAWIEKVEDEDEDEDEDELKKVTFEWNKLEQINFQMTLYFD